jgi:hypothetical protein
MPKKSTRRYTPKAAKILVLSAPYLKGRKMPKRVRTVRRRAAAATRRNKINIAADRQWKARTLVPIKRYVKGKNARRFDLGVKVGGRMRRVWD